MPGGKIGKDRTLTVRPITADEIQLGRFDELIAVYRFIEGHPDTLGRLCGGTSTVAFVERFELREDDSRDRSS
jgi:hypothetical protein